MSQDDKIIQLARELGIEVEKSPFDSRGAHRDTLARLWLDDKGKINKDIHNISLILENDPTFKSLCFDPHANRNLWQGERMEDRHVTQIRRDLIVRYGMRSTKKDIEDAMIMVASTRQHEPIKDFLQSLKWDGTERIARLLTDVFNAETLPAWEHLIQRMGLNWFVSCVARIYEPGCKADTCLVLVSPKGYKKGTSFKILAGDKWFSDSDLDISGKKGLEKLHQSGKWIWEFAEMKSFQGRTAETAKAFLTSGSDLYRAPYARNPIDAKRRTVFCASTNNYQFLTDGAERRFYPVTLTDRINLEYLRTNRDQIWAEAVELYKTGYQWWFDVEELKDGSFYDWEAALARYQMCYIVDDPWAGDVAEYLDLPTTTKATNSKIFDFLSIPHAQRSRNLTIRMGEICRSLGYDLTGSNPRYWTKK